MKEIFWVFLRLGCHSFGGPTAHFGYFHEEFVKRKAWISESDYADMVAFCQFLPGPSSSQTGFAIGLNRGGILGAFLAWIGFTLPSAAIMIALAAGVSFAEDLGNAGWVAGLKLTALAVVANAAWAMASKLCPDRQRRLLAAGICIFLLLSAAAVYQILAILIGAIAGFALYRNSGDTNTGSPNPPSTQSAFGGVAYLALFFLLLLGLPVLSQLFPQNALLSISDSFYRAGSLVFGGGHVVLPLLDSATVQNGYLDESTFLAGYGSAQALPGPLFAFSAFLGAALNVGPGGIAGGTFALFLIYLPSWLLVLGALPLWNRIRQSQAARASLMGANAAVVGLLFAALYDPIWLSSINNSLDLAFAIGAFALLKYGKIAPWAIVLIGAGSGAVLL